MIHQPLSERFAVAQQVSPDDVARLADAGYTTIICNRPDGEEFGQPTAAEVQAACEANNVDFHYLPFAGAQLPVEIARQFVDIVRDADGPVLAYCRSGQRSTYLYASTRHYFDA